MDCNLPKLIQQAFLSSSNEARLQAESLLQQAILSQRDIFLIECGRLFSNESQDPLIRSGSATLIKNVVSKLPVGQILPEGLKHELLKSLVTKDKQIKSLGAQTVAVLAVHDFQSKIWLDLIPNLANNLTHVDLEVKKAAIMTLGYICEALKDKQLETFLEISQIEEILKGILLGLKKTENDKEVKLLAVSALNASMGFMITQYEKKEIRDYMLDLLISVCTDPHKSLKIKGLQCLMDMIKILYAYLPEYLNIIFQVLSPLCVEKDNEISVLAIEFWNTIAQEDSDRNLSKKNMAHICLVQDSLVKILLQNLLIPIEEEDEDEVNTKDSSYKCLLIISEVVGDNVLNNFIPFISNTIISDQPNMRQASMMAFSAMLEGPGEQTLAPMIVSAFGKIITLLSDSNQNVKKWTSVTIQRIAEYHPLCILSVLEQSLPIFFEALKQNSKVAQNICWTFYFLSERFEEIPQSHAFYIHFESIIQALIQLSSLPQQDTMLIDISFSAIIQMIKNCKNKLVSQVYLEKFIQLFQQSGHIQIKEQRDTVKRGLCTGIHACLYGVEDISDKNLIQGLYSLMIEDFKQTRDVHDDGIAVITALAYSAKLHFAHLVPEFFNYLKVGLEKINEKDVFKVSLDYISQIAKSCPKEFEPFIQQIIPPLMSCLNRQDFDNELKLSIFECLGDSSLYYPGQIIPHLEQILNLVKLGFNAAIQLQTSVHYQKQSDVNQVYYSDQLKETLVQTFTCLLHSMQDHPEAGLILNELPLMMEILRRTTDNKINPTVVFDYNQEYLRNSLAMISDFAFFYGDKVTSMVKQQFVQDIVHQLSKFQHIKQNQEILKYALRQISKLK